MLIYKSLVLYHVAPELLRIQHQNSTQLDATQMKAADIFGLGMIIYQVHTRQPLFAETNKTAEGTQIFMYLHLILMRYI